MKYSDISQYVTLGMTAAQIAEALNNDPRHKRDVMATGAKLDNGELDLLHILSAKFKLMRLASDATWKGPLIDYFNSVDDSDLVKQGFELLLSQLQITGRKVFCHSDPATGYLTTELIEIVQFVVDNIDGHPYDSQSIQEEMDNLTGGLMFNNVTASEVQAVIDDYNKNAALTSLQNDINGLFVTETEKEDWTIDSVKTAIIARLQ